MDQSQYKDVGDIQYLQSSIFQAFTKRKMENKVAEAPVELIAQAMDCFIKPKHHRDSGWMGAQVPSLQELRTSFFSQYTMLHPGDKCAVPMKTNQI
jgi:hypothetical protein